MFDSSRDTCKLLDPPSAGKNCCRKELKKNKMQFKLVKSALTDYVFIHLNKSQKRKLTFQCPWSCVCCPSFVPVTINLAYFPKGQDCTVIFPHNIFPENELSNVWKLSFFPEWSPACVCSTRLPTFGGLFCRQNVRKTNRMTAKISSDFLL